ncbi:MAG TPA: pyrroline-5-carboxylate reductase [Desulfurococcales archaeon]|nr:pyrroline-5-carboxylate reductase [Desulfurococcales archaeon]
MSVIGAGKIGSTIIKALRKEKPYWTVIGTGRSEETLAKIRGLGAIATRDNKDACRRADVIILSVKPYHLPIVINDIRDVVNGKTILSVIAGVKTRLIEEALPGARVIRAMPNINAIVKSSITALSAGKTASSKDKAIAEEVFRTIGDTIWIPEEYMDAFTALIGSGPGIIAELIDALVLGAVATGMPRELAYRATLKLLEGTIKTLERTGWHPAILRDIVATPAGTTIKGIYVMELRAVKAALMETIQQATKRSIELGLEISKWLDRHINSKAEIQYREHSVQHY